MSLISFFTKKMRAGDKLTVVSPGTKKRNFTHIDDIIDGLILVEENWYGHKFRRGSLESFSILEVAVLFGRTIEMLPERKGNRKTSDVMTAKTQALGWSPNCGLQDYVTVLK